MRGVAKVLGVVVVLSLAALGQSIAGCRLSSNPYSSNSTSNPYGRCGSPYSSDSINNPYGRYGSPYSPHSVTNPYATDAPAITAGDGTYLVSIVPIDTRPTPPQILTVRMVAGLLQIVSTTHTALMGVGTVRKARIIHIALKPQRCPIHGERHCASGRSF